MSEDLEQVKQFLQAKIEDVSEQILMRSERRLSLQEALMFINDLIKAREEDK